MREGGAERREQRREEEKEERGVREKEERRGYNREGKEGRRNACIEPATSVVEVWYTAWRNHSSY